MKVTGIREFRENAPQYLSGDDLIFVTKHGKVASLLVPVSKSSTLPLELRRELLENLGFAISDHLKRAGISERKAANDFKAWRKTRRQGRGGR